MFDVASQDLYTMGIMVVSYTIKDVSDEVGRRKMTKYDSMVVKTSYKNWVGWLGQIDWIGWMLNNVCPNP